MRVCAREGNRVPLTARWTEAGCSKCVHRNSAAVCSSYVYTTQTPPALSTTTLKNSASCGSSMHATLFRSLVAAHFLLLVSGMAGKSLLKSTTPRMAVLSLLAEICQHSFRYTQLRVRAREGNRVPLTARWTEAGCSRECVLFIGTQFSNLYTVVDTPAKAAWFGYSKCVHRNSGGWAQVSHTFGFQHFQTRVWVYRHPISIPSTRKLLLICLHLARPRIPGETATIILTACATSRRRRLVSVSAHGTDASLPTVTPRIYLPHPATTKPPY